MTAQNLFGDLALDATLQALKAVVDQLSVTNTQIQSLADETKTLTDSLLIFGPAILKRLPRTDTNERMTVRMEAWDTSAGANVGTFGGSYVTNLIPFQIAQMGANHLYAQIQVSA